MKKVLILFFIACLIVLMTLPTFAATGDDRFGENLLSSFKRSNFDFYKSPNVRSSVNSLVLDLSENSSYSFISDIGVTDFYLAPIVGNNAYGFSSLNLFGEQILDKTCFNSTDLSTGFHLYNTGCIRANYSNKPIFIDSGVVSISFVYFVPSGLSGRAVYFTVNYTDGTSDVINSLSSVNSPYEVNYTSDTDKTVSNVVVSAGDCSHIYLYNLCIRNGADSSYTPFYGRVYHSSDLTSLYNLSTDYVYNDYALIFGNPSTGLIPSDNTMYFVNGELTINDITSSNSEASYNSGYDSGYDDGYKNGEYDGLEASKGLSSMVLTVLSAPFVIISNTLNFEILGINILNLVKVILTVLVVAFAIRKLKGGG